METLEIDAHCPASSRPKILTQNATTLVSDLNVTVIMGHHALFKSNCSIVSNSLTVYSRLSVRINLKSLQIMGHLLDQCIKVNQLELKLLKPYDCLLIRSIKKQYSSVLETARLQILIFLWYRRSKNGRGENFSFLKYENTWYKLKYVQCSPFTDMQNWIKSVKSPVHVVQSSC